MLSSGAIFLIEIFLTNLKKKNIRNIKSRKKLFIKQRQKDIGIKGHFANVNSMPKDDSLKCPTSGTLARKIKKTRHFNSPLPNVWKVLGHAGQFACCDLNNICFFF